MLLIITQKTSPATQISMHSEPPCLASLRSAVQELGACRDCGIAVFKTQEPVVARLLCALDNILDTDTREPGGCFGFLQLALDQLPSAPTTHGPLTRARGKTFATQVESFRYWLICALNTPNALKETLQRTLAMPDIVTAFFTDASYLHSAHFCEQLLLLVTEVGMHGTMGPNLYDLDVGALQLFDLENERVEVIKRRSVRTAGGGAARKSLVGARHRPPPPHGAASPNAHLGGPLSISQTASSETLEADGAGGNFPAARSLSVLTDSSSASGTSAVAIVMTDHCVPTNTTSERGSSGARATSQPQLSAAEQQAAAASLSKPSSVHDFPNGQLGGALDDPNAAAGAGGDTAAGHKRPHSSSVHRAGSHIHSAPPSKFYVVDPSSGRFLDPHTGVPLTVATFTDAWSQADGADGGSTGSEKAAADAAAAAALLRLPLIPQSTQTDAPSPMMSFSELVDFERVLIERDRVNKASAERNRRREQELEEQSEDMAERLDAVVSILRNLKTLYNDHFTIIKEAQDAHVEVDRNRVQELLPQMIRLINKTGSDVVGAAPGKLTTVSRPDTEWLMVGSTVAGSASPPSVTSTTVPRTSGTASGVAPFAAGSAGVAVAAPGGRATRVPAVLDTPPPNGTMDPNRAYIVNEICELPREVQLQKQQNRCADCREPLQEASSNPLMKAVQLAAQQKPRRCHYSGGIYCHKCHSNKVAVLPFKVLARWDFTPMHVCNRDYDFLTQTYDKPVLYYPTLPQVIRQRPLMEKIHSLRGKAAKLQAVLSQCGDAIMEFGDKLYDYHVTRQNYFSLADLSKMNNMENGGAGGGAGGSFSASGSFAGGSGGGANSLPLLGSAVGALLHVGGPNLNSEANNLVLLLENFLSRGRDHVAICELNCRSKCISKCSLCAASSGHVPDRVVFFDNGEACAQCGTLFHAECFEVMGCPVCKAAAAAAAAQRPHNRIPLSSS